MNGDLEVGDGAVIVIVSLFVRVLVVEDIVVEARWLAGIRGRLYLEVLVPSLLLQAPNIKRIDSHMPHLIASILDIQASRRNFQI